MGKDKVISRLKEITDRSHNSTMIADMNWLENASQEALDELNTPQMYSNAYILRSLINYCGVSPDKSDLIFVYNIVQYDWLLKALEKYPEDMEFIQKYHQAQQQRSVEAPNVEAPNVEAPNIRTVANESHDIDEDDTDDGDNNETDSGDDACDDDCDDIDYNDGDSESETDSGDDDSDDTEYDELSDEESATTSDEDYNDVDDEYSSECECEGCNPDIHSMTSEQPEISSHVVKSHADVLLESLESVLQKEDVSIEELEATYQTVFDVNFKMYRVEMKIKEKLKQQKDARDKLHKICDALKDVMEHKETFGTLLNNNEKLNILHDLVSALQTCVRK